MDETRPGELHYPPSLKTQELVSKKPEVALRELRLFLENRIDLGMSHLIDYGVGEEIVKDIVTTAMNREGALIAIRANFQKLKEEGVELDDTGMQFAQEALVTKASSIKRKEVMVRTFKEIAGHSDGTEQKEKKREIEGWLRQLESDSRRSAELLLAPKSRLAATVKSVFLSLDQPDIVSWMELSQPHKSKARTLPFVERISSLISRRKSPNMATPTQ